MRKLLFQIVTLSIVPGIFLWIATSLVILPSPGMLAGWLASTAGFTLAFALLNDWTLVRSNMRANWTAFVLPVLGAPLFAIIGGSSIWFSMIALPTFFADRGCREMTISRIERVGRSRGTALVEPIFLFDVVRFVPGVRGRDEELEGTRARLRGRIGPSAMAVDDIRYTGVRQPTKGVDECAA